MHWITSTLIALFAIIGTLRAERELFVFDNAFSDIKPPDEQAALLKKLGSDGICTRPQNATPECCWQRGQPYTVRSFMSR